MFCMCGMCFPKFKSTLYKTHHRNEEESSEEGSWFVPNALRRMEIATDPKFLIVGAGAAGIACAVGLIKGGFRNVVIAEAENRIGGRIHTIPFADNVIDLGAQWCHGEKDNVVFEIVEDMNLVESSGNIYITLQCRRSNGEVLPDSLVNRFKEILRQIFQKRHNLRNYTGSFGQYLTEHYYNELAKPENADINIKLSTEFFENFKKIESSETAAVIDVVSARGLSYYWECEGDYMLNWRDKGFKEFFKVLTDANVIGKEFGVLEDRIAFNTRVTEIHWNRPDAKVEVKCEKMEEKLLVDHVVVTCSLGVLKQCAKTMFYPELPPSKLRPIEGIGFGTAIKIFLEFKAPFWPKDWAGFTTLWREEDLADIRSSKRAWVEDIYGFYRVSYQPRVLLAWHIGQHIDEVEAMSTEAVKEDCLYLMRRFLKGWNIPQPLKVIRTTWTKKRNFLGSYSFRSMDTENVGTSATELAQPITVIVETQFSQSELDVDDKGEDVVPEKPPLSFKPVVLFAGEATSTHHYGSVHGAVETGMREAARLTGYYKMDL